jgi:16S rRNA pseudouridine516 synthase
VLLDGEPVFDPGLKVRLGRELAARIQVAEAPLDPPPPLILIMHKPLGLVCSHDEVGRSIYELLPERWRRRSPVLSSIGRLDSDTTGLLLLTDDGALLHKVISPRRHIAKRYQVVLERPLAGCEAAVFASGAMKLDGDSKPLAPAKLEPLGPTTAMLTVTEGRYHQVRRMFSAVGNGVLRLHRDRVGGLSLPADLPPGAWRILEEPEQNLLFETIA